MISLIRTNSLSSSASYGSLRVSASAGSISKSLAMALSRQAQEVLSAARRLVPGSRYVFRVGARPFPRREVTALLRSLNLVDEQRRPATMHGLRATCRVWAMDSKITFESARRFWPITRPTRRSRRMPARTSSTGVCR